MSKTVFLVDDHDVLRKGLRELLELHDFEIVGEARDSQEGFNGIMEHHPEVAVIDLNLETPGAGMHLVDDLRRKTRTKLVVYSYRENIHTISHSYELGADAYVPKSKDPSVLIDVINQVLESNQPVYIDNAQKKIAEFVAGQTYKSPMEVLNEKELMAFKLLAEGLTNEEVSETLEISPKRLSNMITDIKGKIGCDRGQFTKVALLYDIIAIE